MITSVCFARNGSVVLVGTYLGIMHLLDVSSMDGLKWRCCLKVASAKKKDSQSARKITGIQVIRSINANSNASSTMNSQTASSSGIVEEDSILVTSNDSRLRVYVIEDIPLVSGYRIKFMGLLNESSQIKGCSDDRGKYVLSGSEDGRVYLWNLNLGESSRLTKSNDSSNPKSSNSNNNNFRWGRQTAKNNGTLKSTSSMNNGSLSMPSNSSASSSNSTLNNTNGNGGGGAIERNSRYESFQVSQHTVTAAIFAPFSTVLRMEEAGIRAPVLEIIATPTSNQLLKSHDSCMEGCIFIAADFKGILRVFEVDRTTYFGGSLMITPFNPATSTSNHWRRSFNQSATANTTPISSNISPATTPLAASSSAPPSTTPITSNRILGDLARPRPSLRSCPLCKGPAEDVFRLPDLSLICTSCYKIYMDE